VLEGLDKDDYGNPQRYSYESEVEIGESLGCGLFNRDGKIFIFYKKNNQITKGLFFELVKKQNPTNLISF
jgi:hypothetical protein